MNNTPERISVHEAASRLGIADETYRLGIRSRQFPGLIIRTSKYRSVYIIPRLAFENMLETGRVCQDDIDILGGKNNV